MYGQNYDKRQINKTVIKCLGKKIIKKKKKRNSSFGGKGKQGVWHPAIKWDVLYKDGATF